MKDLDSLWGKYKNNLPKIKGQLPFPNKKAVTLVYSWLNREDAVVESIKKEYETLQVQCNELIQKMQNFVFILNNAKKQNKRIKTFGYHCSKGIVEFSQCINQRIWFEYSEYLQLPYLLQDNIKSCQRKLKKEFIDFKDFISLLDKEARNNFLLKINPELKEEELNEINTIADYLPYYTTKSNVYVHGFDEILVKDLVTIELEITRFTRKGSKSGGFNHSLFSYDDLKESLVILLIDEEGKLLEEKKLNEVQSSQVIKLGFIPQEVSRIIVYFIL